MNGDDKSGASVDRVGASTDRVGASVDELGASVDRVGTSVGKPFWQLPWSYPQAIVVATAFFLNGWLLASVSPVRDVALPAWPLNFFVFAAFALILGLVAGYARRSSLVAFLAGIPMSAAAMGWLCGLSILAGFIPQGGADWLHSVKGSWPFVFVLTLVLTSLGLAAFRRMFSFKRSDIWFVAVHLGIWIVLAAMACGASDLQKLKLYALEGEPTSLAFRSDDVGRQYPMTIPFEISLRDFAMEEYPPKLIRYALSTGKGEKIGSDVALGKRYVDNDIVVEVMQFFPKSKKQGNGFIAVEAEQRGSPTTATSQESSASPTVQEGGAVSAARIRVTSGQSGVLLNEGWIAASSQRQNSAALHLKDSVLVLAEPEAKLYRSTVDIRERGSNVTEAVIEVNHPFSYEGWKIYQSSYDAESGPDSKLSVLELVKDPWLPVVYFGSILVLIGSLELLWNGLRRSQEQDFDENLLANRLRAIDGSHIATEEQA